MSELGLQYLSTDPFIITTETPPLYSTVNGNGKKMSRMESQASLEATRSRSLMNMRTSLNMVATSNEITQFQVEQLFNQQVS